MIISNSSPLMYLAKIKRLNLLETLFKKIVIPEEVYEEVVEGKQEYLDSLVIERTVNDRWIKIKEIKIEREIEKFASEIHPGEIAVISLSKKLKPSLVLIDDATARTIAESFGFNVKGTLYVLLKAYKRKLINKNELKDSINQLIFSGFRISQELYIEFLSCIE